MSLLVQRYSNGCIVFTELVLVEARRCFGTGPLGLVEFLSLLLQNSFL